MGKAGRPKGPKKLTEEVQKKIINSLMAANYLETACAAAGINKTTLYTWLRKGSPGSYNGSKEDEIYVEFNDAVEKAQAEGEALLLARIKLASTESWQAAAWILERKHPNKWGRKERLDVQVTDDDHKEKDARGRMEALLKDIKERGEELNNNLKGEEDV